MFDRLIHVSLRQRLFVLAASFLLMAYGAFTVRGMPIDVFPDLNKPTVTLLSEAGGMAPEEVEQLVTLPIESSMNGMAGVTRVRSVSGVGLSVVNVEFDWGTDIKTARQAVQERLASVAPDLPPDIRPQMSPVSSILGQVMIAGLRHRPGPNGGDLVRVPDTPYFAERVVRPGAPPELFAWKPTDRNDPAGWEAVPVTGATWDEFDPDGDQRVRHGLSLPGLRYNRPSPARCKDLPACSRSC